MAKRKNKNNKRKKRNNLPLLARGLGPSRVIGGVTVTYGGGIEVSKPLRAKGVTEEAVFFEAVSRQLKGKKIPKKFKVKAESRAGVGGRRKMVDVGREALGGWFKEDYQKTPVRKPRKATRKVTKPKAVYPPRRIRDEFDRTSKEVRDQEYKEDKSSYFRAAARTGLIKGESADYLLQEGPKAFTKTKKEVSATVQKTNGKRKGKGRITPSLDTRFKPGSWDKGPSWGESTRFIGFDKEGAVFKKPGQVTPAEMKKQTPEQIRLAILEMKPKRIGQRKMEETLESMKPKTRKPKGKQLTGYTYLTVEETLKKPVTIPLTKLTEVEAEGVYKQARKEIRKEQRLAKYKRYKAKVGEIKERREEGQERRLQKAKRKAKVKTKKWGATFKPAEIKFRKLQRKEAKRALTKLRTKTPKTTQISPQEVSKIEEPYKVKITEAKEAVKTARRSQWKAELKASKKRRAVMKRAIRGPTKAELKTMRAHRRAAIGTMGLLLPIETSGLARGTGGRSGDKGGRPRGTYKYAIPGKGGVPVQEYRRWSAAQRRLQRMKDQQLIAMAQRGGPHPEGSESLPEEMATRDTPIDYETPEEEGTTYEDSPQVPYEDVIQYGDEQQQYEEEQQPEQEQQQAQYREPPRTDNILNAPNISRGELRNQAPKNPYKGPDDTTKPIVNPDGDYFTDVDPMTGKPLLRRRVRERWIAGDDNANTG